MIPQAQHSSTPETPSSPSTRRPASRWIVAAATLTLGAAATFGSAYVVAQTADAPQSHGPGGPAGWHRGGHGGPGGPMLDRHELTKVGATADQKTQIQTIFKAAFTDLKPSRDASHANHAKMLALLAAPTIDRNAIESLRIQEYQMHDTESRRMTQALVDAASVLTPAQRAQIATDVQAREARMQERMQQWKDHAAGAPPRG